MQKVISRSIYNLKIDTIYMYDIPFDRSFLQLSNGIRHVMPSTDRKLELTAKASVAQPVSQLDVCSNGLKVYSFTLFGGQRPGMLLKSVTGRILPCYASPPPPKKKVYENYCNHSYLLDHIHNTLHCTLKQWIINITAFNYMTA